MKKLVGLFIVFGLLLGLANGVGAIDFKARGEWGPCPAFYKNEEDWRSRVADREGRGQISSAENFAAQQRLRPQLDVMASEALSDAVFFEMGELRWNSRAEGGNLKADGNVETIRKAYLDWMSPDSFLILSTSVQNLVLPSFITGGSRISADETIYIILPHTFNEPVARTEF